MGALEHEHEGACASEEWWILKKKNIEWFVFGSGRVSDKKKVGGRNVCRGK